MKKSKFASVLLAAALAAIGCRSNNERVETIPDSSDQATHNRLMVRMALAENVYNGIAVERALYPTDFHAGASELTELGLNRVATLADAYRHGAADIVVIQGDASKELHTARVEAVRQELADAGLDPERVRVLKTGRNVEGDFSDRALLSFDRMMQTYAPQPGGAPQGSAMTPAEGFGSSNK